MPTSIQKILSLLAVSLALFVTGCASSGNSTSAYGGANVGAAVARQDKAAKSLKSAKSELQTIKKAIKTSDRKIARAERQLKRKRLSKKRKGILQARIAKAEKILKQNEKQLRTAERALKRAERKAKQTKLAAIRAQKREDARQRAALRREEAKRKRQLASAGDSSGSLFALGADPALKNAKDYKARVDEGFKLPAIPIKKMDKRFLRQEVRYQTSEKPGTLIVDTSKRFVYLVQRGGTAMRYGIGVGRAGFAWEGTATMAWKKKWPKWTPPPEMIARQPKLAKYGGENGQKPGINNPLGARALYIFQGGKDTLYRLHGTPQWASIGTAASSGCIRLINQDIIDLYTRVPNGAKIVVKQS